MRSTSWCPRSGRPRPRHPHWHLLPRRLPVFCLAGTCSSHVQSRVRTNLARPRAGQRVQNSPMHDRDKAWRGHGRRRARRDVIQWRGATSSSVRWVEFSEDRDAFYARGVVNKSNVCVLTVPKVVMRTAVEYNTSWLGRLGAQRQRGIT